MQRPQWLLVGFAALMTLGFAFPGAANGRPQYATEMMQMYADKKAAITPMKCSICHGEKGANKKKLNEYGTAVDKALGEKNVKDKEKIRKALKEAEPYLAI
jgi:hypothetical protein